MKLHKKNDVALKDLTPCVLLDPVRSSTWRRSYWKYPNNGHLHSENIGMSDFMHNPAVNRTCAKTAQAGYFYVGSSGIVRNDTD
jgi:hypothetical protein